MYRSQYNRQGTSNRPNISYLRGGHSAAAAVLGLVAAILCGGCPGSSDQGGLSSIVNGANNIWSPLDAGVLEVPDLSVATMQGEPLVIVLGNDLPASVRSAFQIELETAPVIGSLSAVELNPDQQFEVTYTPPTDFVGSETFAYRAVVGEESSNTSIVSIRIHPRVYFEVTPLQGTSPLTVQTTAYTLTRDALPEGTYYWRFGDQEDAGPMATHRARSYTFRDAGVYAVTLSCTLVGMAGPVGCSPSDTQRAQIQVYSKDDPHSDDAPSDSTEPLNKAPVAVLDPNRTVIDADGDGIANILLDGRSSYDPDGHISHYRWFDHAAPLAEGAIATVSLAVGSYKIVLSVEDDDGVTDSAVQLLQVLAAPDRTISGHIADGSGAPLSGVVMNGLPDNPMTDVNGNYSTEVPHRFSGTATPQKTGYDFTPASRTYTTVTTDRTGENYTGSLWTWTISGKVLDDVGNPISGVALTTSDGGGSDTSDAAGQYALEVPHGWSGTVTPAHPSYGFVPSSRAYTSITANKSGQNYMGTPQASYAISGTVKNWEGNPYAGVPIRFTGTGASAGVTFTATTLGDGTYMQEVPFGWSGTVSSDENHRLEPATRDYVNVAAPTTGNDFAAFRNFYVDKPDDGLGGDGSDSLPGTLTQPLATIQGGMNATHPGDTVYVRAGVYNETVTAPRNGTSAYPITVTSQAGEAAVMDGQSTLNDAFISNSHSWWVFQGFEIRNYARYGAYLLNAADHCTIRYCRIHDSQTGIFLRGADYALVEWCEIYECSGGIRINWRDTTGDRSNYATVQYNLLYKHGLVDPEAGDGVSISGGSHAEVHHNLCWLNLDDGIDASGSGARYPEAATIHHNVSFFNGFDDFGSVHPGGGDGNGIKVSTNVGGDHTVHHNVCFRNKRAGFDMDDVSYSWPKDHFFNNVAWRNGNHDAVAEKAGFILRGKPSGERAVPLKNCVAWGNNPPDRANPSVRDDLFEANAGIDTTVTDHNVWGRVHVEQLDVVDPTDILLGVGASTDADPGLFQDADAPLVFDFSDTGDLSKDIPASWNMLWTQLKHNFTPISTDYLIDRGTNVPGITDAFMGAAPDIGAFEAAP